MKITHELANAHFEGLDITAKRNVFCILSEVTNVEKKRKKWPKNHILGSALIIEGSGNLMHAVLKNQHENEQYSQIRKHLVETAAACLRMLKNIPHEKRVGESPETEKKYQPKATRKYK